MEDEAIRDSDLAVSVKLLVNSEGGTEGQGKLQGRERTATKPTKQEFIVLLHSHTRPSKVTPYSRFFLGFWGAFRPSLKV